jgi:hypothetical protein
MNRQMIKICCVLLISGSCSFTVHAQKDTALFFLNHIYLVLDSQTYKHIFDAPFLQELGDTSEKKTTTVNESWSGKYFSGLDSYFELFPPSGFPGAVAGNLGFGFMTFKSGDIDRVERNWKQKSKDPIKRDTSTYDIKGVKHTWYYSDYFDTPDSLLSVAIWVMENTPDELHERGFTEEEQKGPISWHQYVEKYSKKKFTKAFNQITAVELITNDKGLDYLQRSLLGFGFYQSNNSFYTNNITIRYRVQNVPATILKKIDISLNRSLEARTIRMSDHITLLINGDKASMMFNE